MVALEYLKRKMASDMMASSIHLEGLFPLTSFIIVDKYLEEMHNLDASKHT